MDLAPKRATILRMSRRSEAESESRKKAIVTGVAAAATVAAGIVAWPLALVGAVPTAFFARDWWKHRVKNGLRV